MFKILHAEFLAPGIKRFVIEAPRIAYKQKSGQVVTGSATVILAMGAGRRAAKSIHEYLTSGEWFEFDVMPLTTTRA
jgi:hypothetical protein